MPLVPLDAISAVTAPDPYEFYSELVAERPLYFDDRLHLWVASSAEAVEAVLANPRCRVRPGVNRFPSRSWDRSRERVRLARRMSDGDRHRALRTPSSVRSKSSAPFVSRCPWASPDVYAPDGRRRRKRVTRFAFRFQSP